MDADEALKSAPRFVKKNKPVLFLSVITKNER